MSDDARGQRDAPPRLAARWLSRRLPHEVSDAIAGDLHAEYVERGEIGHSRLRRQSWYWWQVLTLRYGGLRRGARRLQAIRPTYERAGPGRGTAPDPDVWRMIPVHPSDVRYALRRLLRTPAFTAVAVASLALGIGANTAMFSIVNAVLIRDLPVTDPHELVEVYTSDSDGTTQATSSHPDYMDLRAEEGVFENVVGSRTTIARIDSDTGPQVAFGELVSWDYFQTLGVTMALGRSFVAEEDETPGTHPVAILGHRSWVREFGADPGVLGSSLVVNGRPYTVIGVAPEAFTGSMPVLVTGFYTPLMMTNELMPGGLDQISRRGSRSMFLKARMADGVTVEQANAALLAFSRGLEERYPDTNEARLMSAVPSGDVALHPMVDRVLTPVAGLLLGVVGLVLLIACANLASFLLARAEDRRREIAVRLALGAGRGRLVSQLMVETTLLALLGGVAGLVLAQWTVRGMMAFQPPLPVPIDVEISLDRTVLLFTAGVSLVAGVLFGLAPALQSTNPDVASTLKNEATGGRRGRFNLRNALVVGQISFSFVLLIGAGLFVRSLQHAQHIDPGFDIGPGAVVWPMPELSGIEGPDETRAFYEEFERRLLAEPTVRAVALADRLPLGAQVQAEEYILPGVPSESPSGGYDIDNAHINPGYFDAMSVAIVQGRAFNAQDVEGERVVIVSEAFVDRFYPGEEMVGRTLGEMGGRQLRIVGVAADAKVRTLGEDPRPFVYELQGQATYFGMQVVVRGSGSSEELVAVTERVLGEVAPEMVLFESAKTIDEHLALLLFPPRMAALLLSIFGGLALLLAAIGIYGVVSHTVAKRTRELGIRMSLGASARDVVRMAVGGGMRLVLVGGVIGVALAAAGSWSLSRYLFAISSTDFVTFGTIPILLCVVALLAAWVPARRASAVDPVSALRAE